MTASLGVQAAGEPPRQMQPPAHSKATWVRVCDLDLCVFEAVDVDAELNAAIAAGAAAPYGRVLWPSAAMVAEAVLAQRPLPGLRVLELGAGCGLVSLACAARGAEVLATDIDSVALADLQRCAQQQRLALQTGSFDVCSTAPLPRADIVVVADLLYEPALALAVAARVVQARQHGATVFVGDPGRAGRAAFVLALGAAGVVAPAHDARPMVMVL